MEDEVGWKRSTGCDGTTNGRTTSDRYLDLDARGTSSPSGVRRPRAHQ
jgi:hypothetical protein